MGHNSYWAHTLHIFIHSFKLLLLLASTYYVCNYGATGVEKKKKAVLEACLVTWLSVLLTFILNPIAIK